MTTLRKIISNAYREAGITAVGETPDAEQHAEGLERLNSLIKSLFGNEFGEPLSSANYGTTGLTNQYALAEDESGNINSIYLPANTRLVFNISAATGIFLPPNPQDGARFGVIDNGGTFAAANVTINANGRKIETTNTVVLNTNSLNREWFYREDLGSWQRVTDLIADDQLPWPEEFDDLLITLLAFRLNPRYGAQTDTNMTEVLKDIRRKFRARYRQTKEMRSEDGITILPLNFFSRKYLTF